MGVATRTRIALAAVLLAVAVSAQAADCFTDSKPVSEHGIFPNRPAGPVAWNGSVLGVILIQNGSPLVLARYDANLQFIGESVVTGSAATSKVVLLSGGGHFAVIFLASSGAMLFQEITADGVRIGPEVTIGSAHGIYPNPEFDFTYNASRTRWDVVYTVPNGSDIGLWAMTIPVERSAGVGFSDVRLQFFISPEAVPRIAVASNGIIAVSWFRPNNELPTLFVNLFDSIYTPLGSILFSSTAQSPRLVTNGTIFALMYQAPISGGTELRWVRFDTAARITNADARLLVGSGIDVAPVYMLWNPTLSEWALTYIDAAFGLTTFPGDYRIRRLSAGGALISDAIFTPDSTRTIISGHYNFTWTDSAYVGSIDRFFSQQEGSDSYLVKHCPLLATIKAENLTPIINYPFTFSSTASGGLPPYKYSWDFGDLSAPRPETNITHAYQHTGTYTVTLTVTDALGDRAVVTKTVIVADSVRRRPTRH